MTHQHQRLTTEMTTSKTLDLHGFGALTHSLFRHYYRVFSRSTETDNHHTSIHVPILFPKILKTEVSQSLRFTRTTDSSQLGTMHLHRSTIGKRPLEQVQHSNSEQAPSSGQCRTSSTMGRNEKIDKSGDLIAPIPLRARPQATNTASDGASNMRRFSDLPRNAFNPIRSPRSTSDDEQERKHQRLMLHHRPEGGPWKLKMRPRRDPSTEDPFVTNALSASWPPPSHYSGLPNLGGVVATPHVLSEWPLLPPSLSMSSPQADEVMDEIPPDILLPSL